MKLKRKRFCKTVNIYRIVDEVQTFKTFTRLDPTFICHKSLKYLKYEFNLKSIGIPIYCKIFEILLRIPLFTFYWETIFNGSSQYVRNTFMTLIMNDRHSFHFFICVSMYLIWCLVIKKKFHAQWWKTTMHLKKFLKVNLLVQITQIFK